PAPSAVIRSASARSDRSSSAAVILAVVSGLPSSAGLITVPACSAASRRRSRHADTRVWPRPAQYSGGRPVPAAGAAGCPQPGYLHVVRVIVVVLIGPPRRGGLAIRGRDTYRDVTKDGTKRNGSRAGPGWVRRPPRGCCRASRSALAA